MKKLNAHIKPFDAILYCDFSDELNTRFTEKKLYRVIGGHLFTDTGMASCSRFKDLNEINELLAGKAHFLEVIGSSWE